MRVKTASHVVSTEAHGKLHHVAVARELSRGFIVERKGGRSESNAAVEQKIVPWWVETRGKIDARCPSEWSKEGEERTLLVLITDRERLPAQCREEKHHVLYHVVECQVRRVHRDALVLAVEVYLTKDRKWFSVNRAAPRAARRR